MRPIRALCFLLFTLTFVSPGLAAPGATDRVPAATLLVPFFETGIDPATHPHDTLLVIQNSLAVGVTFHYHVWDIDGNATDLGGNVALVKLQSWDAAMRNLINGASQAIREQLTVGPFYRGFVTIDVVTAPTSLNPLDFGYPFGNSNALQGFIYYTRLSQGSANGLAMVPLESFPRTSYWSTVGFYQFRDSREQIDATTRRCAYDFFDDPENPLCLFDTYDRDIDRINLRIFRSAQINGSSRAVVFTWDSRIAGGPSVYCDQEESSCDSWYVTEQIDGDGNIVREGAIRLDHVVNVIEDSQIEGSRGGWLSIHDIPDGSSVFKGYQVYAFSFNSGSPAGNPNLTWDAIFEGYIVP